MEPFHADWFGQQKPQQCGAIKTLEFIEQVLTTGDF